VVVSGMVIAAVILTAPLWDVGPFFGVAPVIAVLALLAARHSGRTGPPWWQRRLAGFVCVVWYVLAMGVGIGATVSARSGTYSVNLLTAAAVLVGTVIVVSARRTGR
jgi:hypothetical protein